MCRRSYTQTLSHTSVMALALFLRVYVLLLICGDCFAVKTLGQTCYTCYKYPWHDLIHTHKLTHTEMVKPQRLNLVLLCSLNNCPILQSIQLQQANEGVVSSLQRFGDCYLIYQRNEQLLDACTHICAHTVTHNTGTGCLNEGYKSYGNDKTTCCQPPVCNIEGRKHRSQHRKNTQ